MVLPLICHCFYEDKYVCRFCLFISVNCSSDFEDFDMTLTRKHKKRKKSSRKSGGKRVRGKRSKRVRGKRGKSGGKVQIKKSEAPTAAASVPAVAKVLFMFEFVCRFLINLLFFCM